MPWKKSRRDSWGTHEDQQDLFGSAGRVGVIRLRGMTTHVLMDSHLITIMLEASGRYPFGTNLGVKLV